MNKKHTSPTIKAADLVVMEGARGWRIRHKPTGVEVDTTSFARAVAELQARVARHEKEQQHAKDLAPLGPVKNRVFIWDVRDAKGSRWSIEDGWETSYNGCKARIHKAYYGNKGHVFWVSAKNSQFQVQGHIPGSAEEARQVVERLILDHMDGAPSAEDQRELA